LVHAAVPVDALYFPAAHAEHGPPLSPVQPGMQMQLDCVFDATRDCVLITHAVQVVDPSEL
jgi:hypothetical protein